MSALQKLSGLQRLETVNLLPEEFCRPLFLLSQAFACGRIGYPKRNLPEFSGSRKSTGRNSRPLLIPSASERRRRSSPSSSAVGGVASGT